jgi:transcriptional regulator GlxA family with amidase domain
MTASMNPRANEPTPELPVERGVVLVTFDAAQILDVTGPLEVFSSASRFLPAVRYRTEVVTTWGGPVHASCGLEFASTPITEVTGPVDTLMVAGGANMDAVVADRELLDQVRRLAADARRVTSVCSGAFVLAAAGLLEGRRATTHWAECALLAVAYAGVTVDPDAIYVHDGNVWTSAGVTAGIDLALALVADDHGHQAAATIARQLVVYLQRSGGQAQFSALLAGQAADTEPVRDLLSWLRDHLTTTCPWQHWPGRSTCPNDSSPESSKPKSVPPPQTTSKRSGSSPPAGCWRPPTGPSSRSRRPVASEPRRP